MRFKNGDRVIIFNFGDGVEHPGTVRGIAFDEVTQIYIVEPDKPFPAEWKHPWDCITVPDGCLKTTEELY